jgi:hypothetical protein
MHPMVLKVDEDQVEARFGPFGDSANLDVRQVHGLFNDGVSVEAR